MPRSRAYTAPNTDRISGIINRIPLKTGSLLEEGSLLTTVSDINSVYTYFHISEDEYLNYLQAKEANKSHSATCFSSLVHELL